MEVSPNLIELMLTIGLGSEIATNTELPSKPNTAISSIKKYFSI